MNIVERYKSTGLEYKASRLREFLPQIIFSKFDEEKFRREYLSLWGQRDNSYIINSSNMRDHQLDAMGMNIRPRSDVNLSCSYCYDVPKPRVETVRESTMRNERFGMALYNPKAIAKMFIGMAP